MAHNHHAGGSGGGGFSHPTNFNADEARALWENGILVPPSWYLPHEWHVSAVGYAILPLSEGGMLDDLIGRRWQMLPPSEWDLPENAPCRGICLSCLQREQQEELGEFAGPYAGRYNIIGPCVY
jgi:hypothetical protein